MRRKRVWLMDGHNMIFALHGLRALQRGGRGEDARQALAERLELFARERQERVVLVFDGQALPVLDRSVVGDRLFEMVFARGVAGAADEFILREARRFSEQGLPVAVVTDDERTLASRLPGVVARHRVHAFWLEHVEPRHSEDDKRVEGDFSDIEREILAQAAASERGHSSRKPAPPALPSTLTPPPRDAAGERRRHQRERGRLRQERHLKRRGGVAGRR